ncbi:glycoside hydrolase family 44-domain-containing protein [Flammula alnicola]|nr:glycoside hydrolase family 44-domain-containing protein [Flammula alnicola]
MFSKLKLLRFAACVAFAALGRGWENWSWSSDINFAATDEFAGASGSSISVNSSAYAALSVKLEGTFPGYAGLRFDIAGMQPDLTIFIQSTGDNDQSPSIALSDISKTVVDGTFSSLLINFNDLPATGAQISGNDTWDRLTFQAGGNGAFYHIDNIVLVNEIVIPPLFLSAEPLANDIIAVTTQGAVDLTDIHVALNGQAVNILNSTTYVPVDTPSNSITYLNLASPFQQGNLSITAGNATFAYSLPAVQYGSIVQQVSTPINPHIYGVNFPTSASYIQHLGVTISRWGGNAVTAYNPFGGFTNAGNDWYFENRANDDADDWIGWVQGAGSDTLVTVPALDWVSKDATSYSYPASVYPDQTGFDPYNSDAGSGLLPNGSYVTPVPNQSNVYVPWNTTAAKQWLTGLQNKPFMVSIDNEIEIASNTHQDMHPAPMDYDEELARVISFGTMIKEALPDTLLVAPSTCSWWYYWTSEVGYTDNAAHYNIDFLPWFLMQMKQHDNTTGQRLLDYLDIHYYFQPDTSANDAAAKALRLRMTRSLWDTGYVDESWVGTSPQNHQWNPTSVNLIPRFKTLIAQNYPGTKLSVSEWSSTDDTDITGGLVTVDALGIFGRYQLDSATYWATPDELGPIGLAYWLYRGYGTHFGSSSAQVNLASPNPDTQGVYAGTENGKLTLVIVNKNPDTPISFYLANVPTGTYFIRHFGGQAGVAKWQTTITLKQNTYTVVPAYTALFLQEQ